LERELGQAHWAWLRGLLSRGHRVGRWFDLLDVAAGCVSPGLSAIKKGSSIEILSFQVELYDCPNAYELKQKLIDTEPYMKHNKTYLFFSLFSACQ